MENQFRYITLSQQIDVLSKNQYLIYDKLDKTTALNVIEKIGYKLINKYLNFFKVKLSFKDIYKIYQFDSVLKSEALRLIGLIERHIKTVIGNTFTSNHQFNSYAYLDPSNFDNYDYYEKFIKDILQKFKCTDCTSFWTVLDKFSFGDMLKFYNLMNNCDKAKIAEIFNKNIIVFYRELKIIKKVRNVCAHFNDFLINIEFNPSFQNDFSLFFIKLKSWIPDEDEWLLLSKNINFYLTKIKNITIKKQINNFFTKTLKK